MNWVVYILECSDGSLYTGATPDLELRVFKHNQGTASKYTRSRRPIRLVWSSLLLKKREALRLERDIKKMTREGKLELIQKTTHLVVLPQKLSSEEG